VLFGKPILHAISERVNRGSEGVKILKISSALATDLIIIILHKTESNSARIRVAEREISIRKGVPYYGTLFCYIIQYTIFFKICKVKTN
jgi:hypothetical protein